MIESWRPVVGHESAYEVSSFGRIKGLERMAKTGTGFRVIPSTILKHQINQSGYPVVVINCPGEKPRTAPVHRLVVQSFIGPIPPDMVVNHKDGVKTNNFLYNLEICTRAENSQHMARVLRKMTGEYHPSSILKREDVFRIKEMRSNGMLQKDIAAFFGVSRSAICEILRGRTWPSIEKDYFSASL